jgi:signal peptidase I
MKIINRPWWWVFLLFIPIVNLLMFPVVWTETARSYGFNTYKDTALVVLTCGLYLFYINYATDAPYIENRSLQPKSSNGEWVSSIIFAVVAATIVHTYFMQPFVIPSSSLEKTLLVGDYLLVSKFHYGARTPITTVATPMLHDRIPFINKKSYLSRPQLPYFRLPGFQKIKRNDLVVFSWPVDNYEDIGPPPSGYLYKPVDKKSNYVKRCVGVPGDTLEVRGGYVYIDGNQNQLPDRARLQFSYTVVADRLLVDLEKSNIKGSYVPISFYSDRYDISDITYHEKSSGNGRYVHTVQLTEDSYKKLKNNSNILFIERNKFEAGTGSDQVFPYFGTKNWSIDEFGPIVIPEEGITVNITSDNIPLYKRIIETYEGSEIGLDQTLEVIENQVLLNGSPLTTYTFKQDYYWLMGDNRHNSQDARSWGFVPWNHVVGKPVFVWFSMDANKKGFFKSIRWDRVFTTVSGSGKATSFKWVLFVLIGLFVASFFKKKKPASK